jgi:crotonobetainyl-CoA:carnitine CoA-transferase CaiB-like acyl-CoA transferase
MEARGPLAGCKVIEVARFVTGPFAAQLLGDLGADVIKIEDPRGGDPFRGWGDSSKAGYGAPFVAFNRNKRSVTLDLKRPESVEVVRRLASNCDVFIENFRPGVIDRIGLGYDRLARENSKLIYCSITGAGKSGPYSQQPMYDGVGQGLSGLMSLLVNTSDPEPVGPTFSDPLTGLFAAYGVLAALQGRERTGKGQRVETNLLQATMGFMHEPFATFFKSERVPDAYSRPRSSLVFAFTCGDFLPLVIHLSSPEKFWRSLIMAVNRVELLGDERFRTHKDRQKNWRYIHTELRPTIERKTRREWLDILRRADVPCAPIYDLPEVLEDPQVKHLGMVHTVNDPVVGEIRMLGFPVSLDRTPLGPLVRPPQLGEHTRSVLTQFGYGEDEVDVLLRPQGPTGKGAV